jgi:hypothetical protein
VRAILETRADDLLAFARAMVRDHA